MLQDLYSAVAKSGRKGSNINQHPKESFQRFQKMCVVIIGHFYNLLCECTSETHWEKKPKGCQDPMRTEEAYKNKVTLTVN